MTRNTATPPPSAPPKAPSNEAVEARTPVLAITPDSEHRGLIARLPAAWRPYALLARLDRPIGWWLLYWPGACAVLLAGGLKRDWPLLIWLLVGSIAMRGAGCVYNDLIDRDLDAQVERTRSRPLPSGAVTPRQAWIWLGVLCAIGLIVWLMLPAFARWIALASLLLVAAYPFMKRITWWPQAWLGLVFSWAAPVGWAAVRGNLGWPLACLYGGSVLWVIGYDTLYAIQDREDDALVGVRSSALRMGRHIRGGVGVLYIGAVMLWAGALWLVRPDPLVLVALLPVALHLAWQVLTLRMDARNGGADALAKFRSNRTAGFLLALACLVVGNS